MNPDMIMYALRNLMHRKLRSWLTVLSILIGIMSIFALVSFGYGITKYVNDLAEEAGSDKLYIMAKGIGAPGTDSNFYLTDDDIEFVGKINGVEDIIGMYMSVGKIEYNKETEYAFATGFEAKDWILESFTVDIENGRQIKEQEQNKVALGYNYQIPDKIFTKPVKLGDKIEINDQKVEVVGFYEEVGNPQDDSNIYFSLKGMEKLYPELKNKFGYVMVKSAKNVDPGDLADKIKEKLRRYKGQEEGKEDFFVQTFDDAIATFGTVINIINGVLVLIALISMIVASVNIMNTMYTAVLERTKEIGIMKAIGAQNNDILFMFVFESGILGLIGGILGIILGYIISKGGGYAAAAAGYSSLQPDFPLILIFSCAFFAFFVGAIAGLLPAKQAAKQKPVDALRYE